MRLLGSGVLPLDDQRTKYVVQSMLESPEKSWETVETSNIGADVALFNNKLTFSGDYYIKRNIDMLVPIQRPSTIGIGLPRYNFGELKTWGWEVNLKWTDKKGDFNYWVGVNVSDSQNKLVKYEGKTSLGPGVNSFIEGQPINTIWGYKTDGLFQSDQEYKDYGVFQSNQTGAGDVKYLDLNGDMKINSGDGTLANHGDLVKIGDTAPRYTYGIDLGCKWKGFDFSTFIQGVGKRDFVVRDIALMPLKESWRMPNRIHLDYWTPENPGAFWPRPYRGGGHNYLPSDKWVQNGAYIRLKNIQLGYTIPASIVKRIKAERVRVYVSGQDLWEKTDVFEIFDPETKENKDFIYPFYRVVSFGVNVSF